MSDLDVRAVADLMTKAGLELAGPLTAIHIAGGRSNQTFKLTDGSAAWVLRMPPHVGRTPSAHDVGREFTVTSALAKADFPVPPPVLLHPDEEPLGGPCAIAEFVQGVTIQDRSQLDAVGAAKLDRAVDALIDTMAQLHAVDYVAVGLGDFGRPDGYSERQLRRWAGQWEFVGQPELSGLAAEVIARLQPVVPAQERACVVHGDYRIDNTLLDLTTDTPRVAAVVDWEMSTIGDPIADVALMCAYRASALDKVLGGTSAWASPTLPSVADLAGRYERATGADLPHWDAHLGLAYFKIAVIAAGIYHRHLVGATEGDVFALAGDAVEPYLNLALESARAAGGQA